MLKSMLKRALINFDIGVPGALWRTALGFLFVPVVQTLATDLSSWTTIVSLLTMLFAVKVAAAVVRRFVPATDVVRSHWEWRRNLARYHDSYQWRKLLWIGIGLLVGAAVGSPGTRIQWVLGTGCVLAGAVAEVFWRRLGLGLAPTRAA
jgi:uncharacterized membrane protein YfcA